MIYAPDLVHVYSCVCTNCTVLAVQRDSKEERVGQGLSARR